MQQSELQRASTSALFMLTKSGDARLFPGIIEAEQSTDSTWPCDFVAFSTLTDRKLFVSVYRRMTVSS